MAPFLFIIILMETINIKEYRERIGISSTEASIACDMPLRTYQRYEQSSSYGNKLKRKAIFELLKDKYEITEEKGLLTVNDIEEKVRKVLSKYGKEIKFCYLFGSYAKGYAKENSDVDLCVSTDLTGLRFVGLSGELREELKKKIDLLRLSDIQNNYELINEVMQDGIKIYE